MKYFSFFFTHIIKIKLQFRICSFKANRKVNIFHLFNIISKCLVEMRLVKFLFGIVSLRQ